MIFTQTCGSGPDAAIYSFIFILLSIRSSCKLCQIILLGKMANCCIEMYRMLENQKLLNLVLCEVHIFNVCSTEHFGHTTSLLHFLTVGDLNQWGL